MIKGGLATAEDAIFDLDIRAFLDASSHCSLGSLS